MKLKLLTLILLILASLSCRHEEKVAFQGYVEGENIYLASPYSGLLVKLAVQRGQLVKKGQFLFELDPNPQALFIKQYQADIKQAEHTLRDLQNPRRTEEIAAIESQIEQVNAQLKLAELRVKRYRELYEKRVVSKDVYDSVIARYDELVNRREQYKSNLNLSKQGSRNEQISAQQAQVEALQAKLKEATWQLEQKKIVAPAAGIIFDTYYRQGEFVGSQQAVLSLLTPENVHIEFFIPVEKLAIIKVGQRIRFTCTGCAQTGQAIINYISPEAEYLPPLVYSRENDDKLVFRIKATLLTFNQYKPGQPVTVYLP
ncbi:hemolysin D [Legionella beliardensis]|uniref:Hemolysin D n=1 Tax=Legionella beliardensis TaxID=91822 RepID=A0A378HY69_9GAMM|nr:HlyD family efflux transporter periplasmic adaptor subunit [Legionella beliardensis]STX27847.1 hemolysin D [Legionella beliardensis]